jgi:glycosyltransferase involved in cell wall biosynthesis
VLCCCRDEEDIIGAFIEFYLEMGFDAVYIVDNGSSDRTSDIVNCMIRAKKPIHLLHDPRLGFERFLREYYLWAGEENTRWVFFLDCDEFILLPHGAKRYFASLNPRVNCLRLRQREMYPILPHLNHKHEFLLSTRSAADFDETTKDISRFTVDARIYGGKHLIDFPNKNIIMPEDIYIRHYKYRSIEQARKKEINRVQSHSSYSDQELADISAFGFDVSSHWRQFCRKFQQSEGWRDRFTYSISSTEDCEMADWAVRFLQRHFPGESSKFRVRKPSQGRKL